MNKQITIFAALFGLLAPIPVTAAEPVEARPLGNPGEWVTTDDYPADPLINEREGVTRFRLTVNKEGLVSNCEVTQSSGTDELDFTTCSLITQRARFSPARDKRGRVTIGTYSKSVHWVIPNQETLYLKYDPMEIDYTIVVEPDGLISSCNGIDSIKSQVPRRANGCPTWQFEPYLDNNGQPQRKRIHFQSRITVENVP